MREGIFLSPNNDINLIFGNNKFSLIPDYRYAVVRDVGLEDMNDDLIYEGDVLKSKQDDIIGLVAYIPDKASFVLLDYHTNTYYPLGTNICKDRLIIVGNNFENADLLKKELKV